MNKSCRLLLCAVSTLFAANALAADYDYTDSQGVGYYIAGNAWDLAYIPDNALSVVIPENITAVVNGKSITGPVIGGDYAFRDHTRLTSVTLNSRVGFGDYTYAEEMFSGCTALKTVHNLRQTSEIPSRMFYDCPALDFENFNWGTEVNIGNQAFALSSPAECGDINISGNVTIESSSFEGREFNTMTIPAGASLSGSCIICQRLVIDGSYDPCYNTSFCSYLTEIINESADSCLTFFEYGTDFPRLKKLRMKGAAYLSSVDFPTLEEMDLSDNLHEFYVNVIGGTLKTVNLSGARLTGLSIIGAPVDDMTMPDATSSIIVTHSELTSVDFSNVLLYGEGCHVEISNSPAMEVVKLAPEGADCRVYVTNNPALKELYLGSNVVDLQDEYNGLHDIIYAGEIEDWSKLTHYVNIENVGNKMDNGWMRNIDKLWYGHGQFKQVYLTDLRLISPEYVAEGAFAGYQRLESVEISGSKGYIGCGAFHNCTNLRSIDVDCDSIGTYSFYKTTQVETIKLGKRIKTILAASFDKCGTFAKATKVYYAGTPKDWCDINFTNVLWEFNGTVMKWVAQYSTIAPKPTGGLYFNGKLCEDLVFTEYVDKVPKMAFEYNPFLKSVTFYSAYPRYLDDGCFAGCPILASIACKEVAGAGKPGNGEPYVNVGSGAFANDVALTDIGFLPFVRSAGEMAFGNTGWYNSLSDGAVCVGTVLYGYKGESEEGGVLTVPEGVETMMRGALEDTRFASVVLPSTVRDIEDYSLPRTLKGTFSIPASVEKLGNQATYMDYGVSEIIIEDGAQPLTVGSFDAGDNYRHLYVGREISGENGLFDMNLTKMTFGPMVNTIGLGMINSYAAPDCNLEEIVCLNPAPPVFETKVINQDEYEYYADDNVSQSINAFTNLDKSKITLRVPEGSENLYRSADVWKEFMSVAPTAVGCIRATDAPGEIDWNEPMQIFGINGVEVSLPAGSLPAGIYIIRQNGKTAKISVR